MRWLLAISKAAMNSNGKGIAHKSKSRKTSDVLEIVEKNLVGDEEEMQALVEAATLNAQVAQSIYEARTKAELTQTELAKLVGTTQSVISQLENADYQGHSLSMLRRIASALHLKVEMKLVPESAEPQHA
ncbi:MAG: XRE family transcriptional regulator [Pirellulales bacterium]